MLNKFFQQFIGNVAVGNDKVPMLLVGVIAGLNAVVLFTKLYCAFRVAFEVDSLLEIIEINHGENFVFNSKNKFALVER